jgi:hypothetical protein
MTRIGRGPLNAISRPDLRDAFLGAFLGAIAGPLDENVRFPAGKSVGARQTGECHVTMEHLLGQYLKSQAPAP